jgi:DNA recombination protein RmuC
MQFDTLWLAVALSAVTAALSALAAFRPRAAGDPHLAASLGDLGRDLGALRTVLAEDLRRGRDESGSDARALREEVQTIVARLGETLSGAFGRMGSAQGEKVEAVAATVKALGEAHERRLAEMRRDGDEGSKALREEVVGQLKALGDVLGQNLDKGAASQKERLDAVSATIHRLVQSSAEANEALRKTVEGRLETLRQDNATKLEEMRKTVDEKLQGTLEERLG